MTASQNTTWLRCPICYARGKATWTGETDHPDIRHTRLAELSRGFRYVDRGRLYGTHFVCTVCNAVAKEY
jgi:hypothetical protein